MLFKNGFEITMDLRTQNILAKGQKLEYLALTGESIEAQTVKAGSVRL
jgi:hypothetical protein